MITEERKITGNVPRTINLGDSLEKFTKSAMEVLKVIVVDRRPCLLKKVLKNRAEVLYREVRDENQPSKGYLELEKYRLKDLRIWSEDVYGYQELGGEWDKQLNAVGII